MLDSNAFLTLMNELKEKNVGVKLHTSTGTHVVLFQPLMFMRKVIARDEFIKRLNFKLRSTSLDDSFTTLEDVNNLNIPSYVFVDTQTTNKMDSFLEAYQNWISSINLKELGKQHKCKFSPLTKKEVATDYIKTVFFPDTKFGVPLKDMKETFVKIHETTSWDKLVCNNEFLFLAEDIVSLDIHEDKSGFTRYIDKTGWKRNVYIRLDDIRQIDTISSKVFANYWITNKEHISIVEEIKSGIL